jgi:hypothetical protein
MEAQLIRGRCKTSFAVAAGLALSAGVAAAQPAATDAALAQSMAECGRIAAVQQRVACYDALNRAANPASVEARREEKRRNFGITVPKLANPFAAPAAVKQARAARKDEEVDRIVARLDRTSRGPLGQLILTTTEGAVWMLDDESAALQPAQGTEFVIRRGAMGSLFCDLDNWRAIRCKRLQ